jgi:hypothetical protein
MRHALPLSLSLVFAGACGDDDAAPRTAALTAADARAALVDRNWLDSWPRDADDRLHVYRFTPGMGGGVYQDRTVFQGSFELFTFTVEGDRLAVELPHTGEVVRTRFVIERVDGPAPFDLRLTLDRSPRGPRVFYGRSAERGGADLDAALAAAAR